MKNKSLRSLILIMLSVMAALSLFTGCSSEEAGEIRITTLKGPTGMGMSKLMEDNEAKTTANIYTFTAASSPDEVTAALGSGSVDVAALPINLAAKLYTKLHGVEGKEIQIAAINTLGVLYVLENGNTINSVADLKGKKIYATGQGSTPEYILRYILSKNNIDPDKDVTIVYEADHATLATMVGAGKADIAMLPEPNVTAALSASENVRIALSLTDEWNKVSSGASLVQGCIVVRKEFAEKNPKAFSKFLDEYKASVEYVNGSPEEASLLIEKFGIIPKAAVAKKALPNCNICFIEGSEMKSMSEKVLNVYLEADASSVGGALPGEDFYFSR